MRRVLSSWRRPATKFTVAGVAVVAAAVSGVLLNTGPATANLQTISGSTSCNCVVQNTETNEYRAVFGYSSNGKQSGKIELGDNNKLEVTGTAASKIDGVQTTTFEPGSHVAAFATGWVPKDATVSWSVGGQKASANWNKPTCGRDISLPATGNGSGPLLVLGVGLLVAGGAIVLRKRRIKLRNV
jgi:LPXTG-motif cell wall-anchored protein